jgi:hypothetical protein
MVNWAVYAELGSAETLETLDMAVGIIIAAKKTPTKKTEAVFLPLPMPLQRIICQKPFE